MRALVPLLLFIGNGNAFAFALNPSESKFDTSPYLHDDKGVASVPDASSYTPLASRDSDDHGGMDMHMHHDSAPLKHLDEAQILHDHGSTPLSFYAFDAGWNYASDGVSIVKSDPDGSETDRDRTYPGLMVLHSICMGLGFFGVLPLGIALRATKHRYHLFVQALFLAFASAGWVFAVLYRGLTPPLYHGEKHSILGYFVLLLVVFIAGYDFIRVLRRIGLYLSRQLGRPRERDAGARFWSRGEDEAVDGEEIALRDREAGEYEALSTDAQDGHDVRRGRGEGLGDEPPSIDADADVVEDQTTPTTTRRSAWFAPVPQGAVESVQETGIHVTPPRSQLATISEYDDQDHAVHHGGDVFDKSPTVSECGDDPEEERFESYPPSTVYYHPPAVTSRLSRASAWAVYLGEWTIIVLAYSTLITGIVTYSGMCRGTYGNGCLAHLIKGSVFFLYGVVTFCRYLGAFAKFGWAWNRLPSSSSSSTSSAPNSNSLRASPIHSPTSRPRTSSSSPPPSAEMIECALIFIYGLTNTWLERQGAHRGDPFTTRQIQHISIAVMYWFGGLIGMGLESRRVRGLISWRHQEEEVGCEERLGASFNPFPALIIGITGSAMAAHHQYYVYAVQVHELWGNFLVGAASLRCATYLMLWLRENVSSRGKKGKGGMMGREFEPSRPPSEALAGMFLACGGLAMMSSTEEIVFASMRAGHDDVMMLLNVVVSAVCIIFCWCVVTLAVKGWAREHVERDAMMKLRQGTDSIGESRMA